MGESPAPEVRIESLRALRRHNVHAFRPVLRIQLRIGSYATRDSASFPGFVDRLVGWVPNLVDHECSVGRKGGFVERLRRGTYLAHIVEHVAIALQNRVGFPVAFGRARQFEAPDLYLVLVEYVEIEPAKAAVECAIRLVLAAMHDTPFDVDGELERLHAIADEHRLGPTTAAIVSAAASLGIPWIRLAPGTSLVQLGYGIHRKIVQAAQTSDTSAIAVDACQDKPLTNALLRAVGVPVPRGELAADAELAVGIAERLGYPVVVKPYAGNHGRGVTVGLRTADDVRAAYALAADHGRRVLVERHIDGADHRLLVVGGRLVAAARREPAHIVGDGVHTIEELVAAVNRDPRRRPGHGAPLSRIALDAAADAALATVGSGRSAVPPLGVVVPLRTNANLSTGGTATDLTDEVHPANARVAELAAEMVGLDIAGVDLVVGDISRPLSEQGGAIVEVNAAPGLRMHLHPTAGRPRDVATPVVRSLFPEGAPSRIPIVAVTGTNGKTTTTRLTAHLLETAHRVVGCTTTEGTWIGPDRILTGDCSGPRSAEAVLRHPRVEAAVFETARGGILREGLGFDGCTVGVVTNLSADHLGLGGVRTIHDLARVKQVVVEAIRADGAAVLNAEDPLVAEMAAATRAAVVYVATRADHPVLAAHVAAGGAAVYVDDGSIVLQDHRGRVPLIELARVPMTANGRIAFQVENALAATAAAWRTGVNPALIARGLSTFGGRPFAVPGRFDVLDLRGIQVVIDYAHNPAAMRALGQALDALGPRRTLVALGLPGDRRDDDLRDTISATTGFTAEWILHDLHDRRGRQPREVPELLARSLPDGARWMVVDASEDAVRIGLDRARPGDRLVVIADDVDTLVSTLPGLGLRTGADFSCAPRGPAVG